MLNVHSLPLGPVQANCYLVMNERKESLIIDPGGEGEKLIRKISSIGAKPQAILLTHAHFDHIEAVDHVREKYGIPVWIHEREANWLTDPMLNGSKKYIDLPNISVKKADHLFRKEGQMEVSGFTFNLLHTPGHSPGSVSFHFSEDQIAIVGDTLFQGGVGRTDLVQGNEDQLMESITSKLLTLADDTIIYPGHGSWTTPMEERKTNPFLRT
ncbi:MBL fold metallo-hydrolase [Chungangia koreensis]|uniref:MBL fold metallo-hydrolase n=1 Tax=Chungangia koreensis TaxID=752657 RepID=A0ABV8X9S4_9LACT